MLETFYKIKADFLEKIMKKAHSARITSASSYFL